jgi:hypothetical protein
MGGRDCWYAGEFWRGVCWFWGFWSGPKVLLHLGFLNVFAQLLIMAMLFAQLLVEAMLFAQLLIEAKIRLCF